MKRASRILLETLWLTASIVLLGLWLGSFLKARYQYEWQSWRQLPWSNKFQPLELEAKSFYYNRFPPRIHDQANAHLDPAELRRALLAGADWLVSVQDPSGHSKYWYDPVRNQYNPSSDDSFHRQADVGYALTLAYRMTGDGRYLAGARQNLNYLMRYVKELDPDKSYFEFDEIADLGAASIPMFTMLEIRELTATPEYDELLRRLANFLLYLQDKYGTGQFKSTLYYRGDYEFEKRRGWEADFYPGEAMFALAGMYRDFKEARYRAALDRALQFYSARKYRQNPAFLPWTILAFASLYRQTGERNHAEYVLLLTDYLLMFQNLDERDDVYGSFDAFPAIDSASYLEALADAIQLVKSIGDTRRERLYVERATIGLRWILKLQYPPGVVRQATASEKSRGGFRASLGDPTIRIDYNGHAISAITRAQRSILQVSPVLMETPN